MLAIPKPKTLRELILFLGEKPNLMVDRKKITFKKFEDGRFSFEESQYNFSLHDGERELGLTVDQKGFIVYRKSGEQSFTYVGA